MKLGLGSTVRRIAVLAVLGMASPFGSADDRIVIAGGALDSSIVGADVYLETPTPATAPPGSKACLAAQKYVDYVNAGDFSSVAELFAERAVVLEPGRRTARGRSEILDFYASRIGKMRPKIMAVAYVGDDWECMLEIARLQEIQGRMRYVLVSVDHFRMDEHGKFSSMVVFTRPPRTL